MKINQRNVEYWEKRSLYVGNLINRDIDVFIEQAKKEYAKVEKAIRNDLERFYTRYADNEGISYHAAMQLLKGAELEEWKVTLEEYKEMSLSEELEKQVNELYLRSRISRLKALEMQIAVQVDRLNKNLKEETIKLSHECFKNTYYRTTYELQKGMGVGINFAKYNQDAVDIILNKPWQGSDFSTRWGADKTKLLNNLQTTLEQSLIRGESVEQTVRQFAKKMNVSKNWASNIVQTETARICEEATAKSYENMMIEKYYFLATLDLSTCDVCKPLDGKEFKLKERKVAINYPPMHSRCRCTTTPCFDIKIGTRIARGVDGEVYHVPADITYKQWYKKYVEDTE